MDDSDKYCREKTAKSGSSFYYSFLFLPTEQKKAIMAVYAFCREVDDIVDECTDKEIAQKKLAWWHTEIDRVFTDQPQHPVGKALAQIKDRFSLKKHLFKEILQGMSMDLSYQGYQTFEDLRLYCHCVASAPGLLAAEIFGYTNPNTLEYAKNLGIAFQLVNIIRDVGEDANRCRIYLPEDELAKFSLTPQDILEKALLTLPEADKYDQRCGLIMAAIYFVLLSEIEKLHFKILDQRVSLTPLRKLWIAWKTQRTLKPSKKNTHV